MPRPKNAIPVIEKTISLPEDLVAAVDLELFSEVEGKVPFGAWKGFLSRLVKEYFQRNQRAAELAKKLEILALEPDLEVRHLEMDKALLDYLHATGASRAANIFYTTEKWYA